MKIWWCESHEAPGGESACWHGYYGAADEADCQMISALLVLDGMVTDDMILQAETELRRLIPEAGPTLDRTIAARLILEAALSDRSDRPLPDAAPWGFDDDGERGDTQ